MYDDGAGARLYVCGNLFDGAQFHVARLDDDSWTYLDVGGVYSVNDMTVWDDGSGEALYVTGDFDSLDGMTAHNSIAKWDGTEWKPLNQGINAGDFRIGVALQVFQDGSGEKLYLGGTFTRIDGKALPYLARWDGEVWGGVGGGPNNSVYDLCVYDAGGGSALYAVGPFTDAGGKRVYHVAEWDGIRWSDLDGGTLPGDNGHVKSCGVFDDGSGPALFVSGWIESASGKSMCNIAKWDGTEWHDPAGGLDCEGAQSAGALLGVPAGSPFGPSLFAGGSFRQAGGQPTNYIAEYRGCFCAADFDGNGVVDTRDVIAFLNAWTSGDGSADTDGNGAIDTRDVIAFLNLWAAGC
ncbi:MAG TPA: GC-type dockerin domain-anchored protein [Phycisphaerales bacterium]|nr:GC-type dockerin domain-anchored protein [Phycisphaerales bacterium]